MKQEFTLTITTISIRAVGELMKTNL